nr:PREDICTED: uncharacterized protein LOC103368830 [Stegastes partitus]
MTLQLRTKARLFDLHCSVALTDWDMDQELKLATTSDQFYHDDKLNDQYVVQRPSARASRRKDEFIWYDKTSDTFVKPNLWLLVNPNIACPIQYREASGDLCEADEGTKAETRRPPAADLHVFAANDASLQEELLQTVSSSAEFMDSKTLKPGCWPRPPVNYSILIALAILKRILSGPFLLLVLSSTVAGLGSVVSRNYWHSRTLYTWKEAQNYCRRHRTDLATIYTNSDRDRLDMDSYNAWIGLYRKPVSKKKKKDDYEYTFIPQSKTWSEGQQYCQTEYNDLARVTYSTSGSAVNEERDFPVWTGLRFLAGHWLWVNGADMKLSDLPLCPVNWQYCGSLSKNNTGGPLARDCTETKNFLCYSWTA